MDQASVENNNTKKRAWEDISDSDSEPPTKLTRVDSSDTVLNPPDVSADVQSPDAKRIQDDLFSILDESDEPPIQGLDSFIKSFEEEILVPASTPDTGVPVYAVCPQPDLGYLLEASDDELGLPPKFPGVEEKVASGDLTAKTENETSGSRSEDVVDGGLGEIILGFENEIPNYDSFELGIGGESVSNSYNDTGDFVALGGLFDYSDDSYVLADISLSAS